MRTSRIGYGFGFSIKKNQETDQPSNQRTLISRLRTGIISPPHTSTQRRLAVAAARDHGTPAWGGRLVAALLGLWCDGAGPRKAGVGAALRGGASRARGVAIGRLPLRSSTVAPGGGRRRAPGWVASLRATGLRATALRPVADSFARSTTHLGREEGN